MGHWAVSSGSLVVNTVHFPVVATNLPLLLYMVPSQFSFPVYSSYVENSASFHEHSRVPPGSKSWRHHCSLTSLLHD